MINIYNENVLDMSSSLFISNYNIHNNNTRQASHFHIPIVKKSLRKPSIFYLGAVTWNDIIVMSNGVRFRESE